MRNEIVVITLVGPGVRGYNLFLDLIASLNHFESGLLSESTLLVVNDNKEQLSQMPTHKYGFKAAELIDNPYESKRYTPLFYDKIAAGLIRAFKRVAELHDHAFVLKIDTDALVCRPFFDRVSTFLEAHPKAGMVGSFKHDPDGKMRGTEAWWAKHIKRTCGLFPSELLRFHRENGIPFRFASVQRWFRRRALIGRAIRNGWELGDHVLGGACVFSPKVIQALRKEHACTDPFLFEATRVSDDVGISIMTAAMGFELAEFNRNGEVFGVWYEQPTFLADVLKENGYCFVHSIKSKDQAEEEALRNEMAQKFGIPLQLRRSVAKTAL
jgi:hypothetical protein